MVVGVVSPENEAACLESVPGCPARRNLQSHHIHFRSASGADVAWNRTTLCAYHHHGGVHAGSLAIRGRVPDRLVYSLGVGRFRAGVGAS